MKLSRTFRISIITFLLISFQIHVFSQTWENCNEMIITVDDFNTTLDFENQPADCGCPSNGECTLVRIRLVETINGVETPVSLHAIGFMPPLGQDSEPNQIAKDYIDLFDPYFSNFNCIEYQAAGFQHNYLISPVAPEGDEFHVLVCPGSEQGVRNGRFFTPSSGTTLTAATNVNATDGDTHIDVSFTAIPGKYYMAYRNSDNCNDAWVKIDGNSNWPEATSSTMTIRQQQGGTYGNQYEYKVVASDSEFNPSTSALGIWSEGDLGHGGTLLQAYDPNNGCSPSTESCDLDIQFSSDDCANLTIDYFPNYTPDRMGTGLFPVQDDCGITYSFFSADWASYEPLVLPFNLTGVNNFILYTTGTLADGTSCTSNTEHAYSFKPNGVIIPMYLEPFTTTNTNGMNVDFDPPIIMDCPQVDGYESSHVSGDFFNCGCNEVTNTIYNSDGSTVDYIQFIEVECISGCDNDTTAPTCLESNITIVGDPSIGFVNIDFNDYITDECDADLSILGFDITNQFEVADNVDLSCGTTTVFDMEAVDDNNNLMECNITVTVECDGGGMDSCIVEAPFSNLLWSSYLGGDGEEEVVDIFVNTTTGIQYVLGKTNSTDFYSTNPEIGTSSGGMKTFVMAVNSDASLSWSTLINSWDDPHAIDMDPEGYLTLVGVSDNSILPGPTGLPGYDKDHNGAKDILILKMDDSGQDIVYSSYFGGSGDEETQNEERLKVDFNESKIYILGGSTSSDLPINNEIDNSPGFGFACVINADLNNSTLEFATYFKNLNGGITALTNGGLAVIVHNADGDYGSLISSNAIESGYSGFAPLSILIVFDQNYSVEYATYIGPHRIEGDNTQNCQFDVFNGTPQSPNLFDFELRSDNCNNVYWYSKGQGFRQPFFSSDYLLPARLYRPALSTIDDICTTSVNNPLIKINMSDEADPFIEYMLFFGYNGNPTADSSFDLDDSNRPHFITRREAFFDEDLNLPNGNGLQRDLYFRFESDLSDAQFRLIGNNSLGMGVMPIGLKVFDNKAYSFGSISNTLLGVTPTWTDEDGNINSIIQNTYGSGDNDGFISVIDNNELCDGCIKDTTTCINNTMHFDGVNDRITADSPLSGDSDYSISIDFKCGPQTNGAYPRLLGFNSFETEIAIRGSELAYYNGITWRPTNENVADNKWHNVCLVRESAMNHLYLDGILISSLAAPATLNFVNSVFMGGKESGGTEFFLGEMDNVKIWNVSLSESQICENISDGLVPNELFYDFEEGNGNQNNSTITGPIDLAGGDNNGLFSNLSLEGDMSNYLCLDYMLKTCPDPCEVDITPPLVECPTDIAYFFCLTNGIYQPSFTDFDINATDECKLSYVFSPSSFDCDDLGPNQVVVTVIDEAGNMGLCTINFTLLDDNDECVIDSVCCGNLKLYGDLNDNTANLIREIDGVRLLLSSSNNGFQNFAVVTRLDADNNVVWQRQITEQSQFLDFTITEDGNIIVVGRSTPVLVGQTNQCIVGLINGNTGAVMNMDKYEFFGRQTFGKILKHPNPRDAQCPYYIIGVENGTSSNSNANDDVILINLNANLDIKWSYKYVKTADNQWQRDMISLADGNILLIGDQDGGKGVIVGIDGLTGEEYVVYESASTMSFNQAVFTNQVGLVSVGRKGTGSTSTGMITLNNNSEINDIVTFDNRSIVNFSNLSKSANGNYIATGQMQNGATAIVEFNIVNATINILQVKYLGSDIVPEGLAVTSITNQDLLFAQNSTAVEDQIGGVDILIAQFDASLQESCLKDTLLNISHTSENLTLKILDREVLAIPSSDNVSIAIAQLECLSVCEPDDCQNDITNPNCIVQDINVVLDFSGEAVITPMMIDNGSLDDCGDVTLEISNDFFNCDNIGTNTVTLFVTDEAGNQNSCDAIVTIEDKDEHCDGDCCFTTENFNSALESGFTINKEDCNVQLISPENLDNCFEATISWGDGTFSNAVGSYTLSHNYPSDNNYTITVSTVQFANDNSVCNSLDYQTEICVVCNQECTVDQLYVTDHWQYPNYFPYGSVNCHSDVQFVNDDLYAVYAFYNGLTGVNGTEGTTVNILKNGNILHSFENNGRVQVSEIKEHNGLFYLVGSYSNGDCTITSAMPATNSVTLTNNCYLDVKCEADAFVAKFNSSFELVWAFNFGEQWRDVIEDISIINDDEFVITGKTRLAVDFDPNDNVEVLCNSNNSIKSFVAKYTVGTDPLPNCNWVRTIYVENIANAGSTGTGITHDDHGDIYVVGDHGGRNYNNATSSRTFVEDICEGSPILLGTTPALNNFGYLAKYDSNGCLLWVNNIENMTPGFIRGVYPNDVLIDDDFVYVGGANVIGKYKIANGMAEIGPIVFNGLDIEEIALDVDNLYITGLVNSTYRNLDLNVTPVTDGPQIVEGLDVLLSVYTKDFEYLKSLNPGGGNRVNHSQSISVSDDKIAIGANFTSDFFLPNFPNIDPTFANLTLASDRDFFLGIYECSCLEMDGELTSCCDNISSQIEKEINSEYCCSLSIDNDQGLNISAVGIEFIGNGNASFNIGELLLTNDFYIISSTTNYIEMGHQSQSIPQGNITGLIDFCLLDENADQTGPQEFVVTFIEQGVDQNLISCKDTLLADCDRPSQVLCAELSNFMATCTADNNYEVTFTVTNSSSINVLTEIQLSGLPDGYHWAHCNDDPISINTFYSNDNLGLLQGESESICVTIVTSRPISEITQIDFDAVIFDQMGKEFCLTSDYEITLNPCCIACDNVTLEFEEFKPCCFEVNIIGICSGDYYEKMNIEFTNGIKVSNIEVNGSPSGIEKPYEICSFDNNNLSLSPIDGIIDSNPQQNIFSFCISENTDDLTDIIVTFSGEEIKECKKDIQLACEVGECVSEGFSDAQLTSLGLNDQNTRLECNQPSLILDCIDFSEIFVKGRFDCSENCSASVSTTVLLNGQEIKPVSITLEDGTWEIYLSDLIKSEGLYQIVIDGMCDDDVDQCTYSFIISKDCFDCSCLSLADDMDYLWSINEYNDCQIGITPNALNACDTIDQYTINGTEIFGPFGYDEEVLVDNNQSGDFEICMTVTRWDSMGSTCNVSICYTYQIVCGPAPANGLVCENENVDNGSFDEGVQGSLHENEKSNLPGWNVLEGQAYYYTVGGSLDSTSGFIQLVFDKNNKPVISSIVNVAGVINSGQENKIYVFHDVKMNHESGLYTVQLVIGLDTLDADTPASSTSHENIWESKLISFEPTDDQLVNLEENGFELIISNSPMVENLSGGSILTNVDNVCVEVEKKTVSTSIVLNNTNVTIYPNPFNSSISIEFDSEYDGLHGEIFDVVGKKINSFKIPAGTLSHNLNLANFINGVYYFKLFDTTGKMKFGQKIIKI